MRTGSKLATFGLVVSLLVAGDNLEANEPDPQPLVETAHRAHFDFKEGNAHIRVRRAFRNRSKAATSLGLEIPLPGEAVLDSFRFRLAGRWVNGEITDADAAYERYETLKAAKWATRGIAPALLAVHGRDSARLDIASIERGQTVSSPICRAKSSRCRAAPPSCLSSMPLTACATSGWAGN